MAGIKIKAEYPFWRLPVSCFQRQIEKQYTTIDVDYDFLLQISSEKFKPQNIPYDPYNFPVIVEQDSHTTIILQSTSRCILDWEKRSAIVSIADCMDKKEMLFYDYLKLLFSMLLIQKGGIPLHCSTVVYNKKGIVFFGPSGIGKSTIAKLLSPIGYRLNDDANFLYLQNSIWHVCSTPFIRPENYSNTMHCSVPISHIFALSQAPENNVSEMSTKSKVMALTCSMYSLSVNANIGNKVLENAENICKAISLQKLFFKNDASINNYIKQVLGSSYGI